MVFQAIKAANEDEKSKLSVKMGWEKKETLLNDGS